MHTSAHPSPLRTLAERVAALNPDVGRVGAGMLAQLVTEARRALEAGGAVGGGAPIPLALSEDNAMPAPTEKQLAAEAVRRLWNVANGHSGQCRYVAAFLLGLYNGRRFPFDLTNFRGLDAEIFRDCLEVLVMDFTPWREVHDLLCVPGVEFERLARDWRLTEVAA